MSRTTDRPVPARLRTDDRFTARVEALTTLVKALAVLMKEAAPLLAGVLYIVLR